MTTYRALRGNFAIEPIVFEQKCLWGRACADMSLEFIALRFRARGLRVEICVGLGRFVQRQSGEGGEDSGMF